MSLSKLFVKLGAPLANVRWSWGSVRPDGTVVLRVWQDRTKKFEEKSFVQLTHLEKYGDDRGSDNHGYSERLHHVQLIRNGANAILVMCLAKNPTASPREILSFNREDVFIGGSLRDVDGDTWIHLANRVPIKSVI